MKILNIFSKNLQLASSATINLIKPFVSCIEFLDKHSFPLLPEFHAYFIPGLQARYGFASPLCAKKP